MLIGGVTMLGAINLYLFLRLSSRAPRFSEFLPIYWTAWAIGLVVPGQVGDMASVTALLHRRGHSWQAVLARSLLDKLISFIVMILVAVFALLPFVRGLSWQREWLIALMVVVPLTALFVYLLTQIKAARLSRWADKVSGIFSELTAILKKAPGYVLLNVLLTLLKTFMMGAAYWAIFRAIGVVEIDILSTVPLVAASALVAYIPVSFNGLGTVEAMGLMLFASLGIAAPVVLAAYLALRLLVLALAWLPAGVWILSGRREAAE
ncbi:MAG: hypothetical protein A2150_00150 [Candidatus Muproteobacteria bacterium RBG_16_64_11]|uniref:TIGR00374 family protein n=1 Tax=Candidatus Muproteobacteria bacterium RBG_16_64_11 TaxID=1817758 RepID=A0A1F6TAG0_9PROT|nr:MAG: hypothetical protein A2150_00150 [Candidatus Muproteobacteria bacterium RBG_16_64_11]